MEQRWCPPSTEVDTTRMSDPSTPLRLEVVGVLRNGRRQHGSGQQTTAGGRPACSQGVIAGRRGDAARREREPAAQMGRWAAAAAKEWCGGGRNRTCDGSVRAGCRAVRCGWSARTASSAFRSSTKCNRLLAARHTDPPAPRLTVEMRRTGVTLRLECSGRDVELVSAMIVTLGRCDVPAGR